MGCRMAAPAQRDEVRFGIVALLAAPGQMMNLQLAPAAIPLAPPTVTLQYPPRQLLVGGALEAEATLREPVRGSVKLIYSPRVK